MMFLFRSTSITATMTIVCAFAMLGQFTTVHAAPQFGMRPKFNVYGIDTTDSALLSYLPPSATARLATASAATESAISSAETAETTQSPESSSSDDAGTQDTAQASAAISTGSGLGIALLVSSIAAVIQIL